MKLPRAWRGLIWLAACVIACAPVPARVTDEDAAVYDALFVSLDRIFVRVPAPPPLSGVAPVKPAVRPRILLRPDTIRSSDHLPDPNEWRDLFGRSVAPTAVPRAAVREFEKRNAHSAPLARLRPPNVSWAAGSPGIGTPVYSISLPGYSRNRQTAVMEVAVSDSPMSGGGAFVYLERIAGKWRVAATQRAWIS